MPKYKCCLAWNRSTTASVVFQYIHFIDSFSFTPFQWARTCFEFFAYISFVPFKWMILRANHSNHAIFTLRCDFVTSCHLQRRCFCYQFSLMFECFNTHLIDLSHERKNACMTHESHPPDNSLFVTHFTSFIFNQEFLD